MNKNNDETIAHQAADVVDNVADGVRSAAHHVGGSVRNAAHAVREVAGQTVGAVGETYDQVNRRAHDFVDHSRARVRSLENNFEQYVRDNPKSSVLLAAALGAVAFAWWKRK